MSEHSVIGWTDATWNPVTGCSRVSPGCEHCYAETLSLRMGWSKKPWTAQNAPYNVKTHSDRLDAPLRWRTPRRVFVNSMSDLFHPLVPDEFIADVFARIISTPRHTYQILTKRPDRMRQWCFPVNAWAGVSAEDQRRADERIPVLLETPAAVRFVSFEPLLERIEFAEYARTGKLHWAITGGETGKDYREADPDWTANIVATCDQYGIAPFVKQDSGPRPGKQGRLSDALWKRKEYPVGVGQQRDLEGL